MLEIHRLLQLVIICAAFDFICSYILMSHGYIHVSWPFAVQCL